MILNMFNFQLVAKCCYCDGFKSNCMHTKLFHVLQVTEFLAKVNNLFIILLGSVSSFTSNQYVFIWNLSNALKTLLRFYKRTRVCISVLLYVIHS